jgi:hypothetical protein
VIAAVLAALAVSGAPASPQSERPDPGGWRELRWETPFRAAQPALRAMGLRVGDVDPGFADAREQVFLFPVLDEKLGAYDVDRLVLRYFRGTLWVVELQLSRGTSEARRALTAALKEKYGNASRNDNGHTWTAGKTRIELTASEYTTSAFLRYVFVPSDVKYWAEVEAEKHAKPDAKKL